ncbi:MAG TPA: hypothetical protein PLO67_02140 [Saprospiraceae bacterium]|nr:hypothetical protein [Saprospiraceae bacterium]HPI07479.1 hypothetical protein [Saprospiraceae bacterium]
MGKALPTSLSDKPVTTFFKSGLFVSFILFSIGYWLYHTVMPVYPEQLKMEQKSSGKNGKHANPDAQQSAEAQYERTKSAHDELLSKPNKTKEDVKELHKLKNALKHWRKKKDWKGENHSQKSKGN